LKLVASSVVRGSLPGESHGGVHLVDLDAREVVQALEWVAAGINFRSPGGDRGPRGIAVDGDVVYIAASEELFAFTPDFRRIGSWRNSYLKDCQEITVWGRSLFLTSAGCDTILGFDLDRRAFNWAMQVAVQQYRFHGRSFDPLKDEGPLMLDRLHLNALHCTRGGMYLSGLGTGGMLLFNGREIRMAVELPTGARNARPFRDGVLFNDTESGLLRYAGRDGAEDRALSVPAWPGTEPQDRHLDDSARPGFARGLAVLSDTLVAGGSSPSTISVYDLPAKKRLLSVMLTTDVRSAIHTLAVWPF
jgi:hypothetical protein